MYCFMFCFTLTIWFAATFLWPSAVCLPVSGHFVHVIVSVNLMSVLDLLFMLCMSLSSIFFFIFFPFCLLCWIWLSRFVATVFWFNFWPLFHWMFLCSNFCCLACTPAGGAVSRMAPLYHVLLSPLSHWLIGSSYNTVTKLVLSLLLKVWHERVC